MAKSPQFKRIEAYTSDELQVTIDEAIDHCESHGLNFWTIFKGADAYFEKRRRRNILELEKRAEALSRETT